MTIEDALLPRDRETLERLLEVHGICRDGWMDVAWLRLVFEALAVEAEADRLEVSEGRGRDTSVLGACIRLGVNPDTYSRRIREARRTSRGEEESAGGIRLPTSRAS